MHDAEPIPFVDIIAQRVAVMQQWYADPANDGMSFFDAHPQRLDLSDETRRAALTRQSAMTATGIDVGGGSASFEGS